MSCSLAVAAVLMLGDPNVVMAAAQPPVAADAPVSVAGEPLFIDIVRRSGSLLNMVEGWTASGAAAAPGFLTGPAFTGFKTEASALAALDMQAHLILKDWGVDGDLKCILRGISEDMPKRVEAVETAASAEALAAALSELAYLLDDNAAVIIAPPQPAS